MIAAVGHPAVFHPHQESPAEQRRRERWTVARDIQALDLASIPHRLSSFRGALAPAVERATLIQAPVPLTEGNLRNLARNVSVSTLAASIGSHATTLRNHMPVYDGASEVLVQARHAPDRFARFSNMVAVAAGNQWAFIGAIVIVLVWLVCGPSAQWSNTWQLVINTGTTVGTFLMIFLVQNTQNREAATLSLKIDELMRLQHEVLMFQRSALPENHPARLALEPQADRPALA